MHLHPIIFHFRLVLEAKLIRNRLPQQEVRKLAALDWGMRQENGYDTESLPGRSPGIVGLYTGMLECFLGTLSIFLFFSTSKSEHITLLVVAGSMIASMNPRVAAAIGFPNRSW